MSKAQNPLFRVIRLPTVLAKTGVSRNTIRRLVKRGDFPSAHKLSERTSVWNEAEVDSWLKARLEVAQ
ncbi:AlpA family transcriptional regulator [Aquidulcibacter sp.]|uniref:helix-turn-helix transcriptional regulator n=1 Tax=Aquidulcibacter sp. TaxID=2052990 RepID=UPI0025C54881|nr:AlpA family phage regulatory protein [Aquidulcibacter sp.]MCA3692613.1 AlpA family phage regulatory protein [Aquidulcibacter sp.]